MRRLTILATAALALISLGGLSHGRTTFKPGTLDLVYEITAGGFVLALGSFTLKLDARTFDLKLTIEPGGVPSIYYSSKLKSRAEGLTHGTSVAPGRYRSEYLKENKLHRSVSIEYGAEAMSQVLADPTLKEDKRPPLTAPLAAGTLDPLSAALTMVQAVGASGRCAGERSVYDGRRRFQVEIVEPTAQLQTAGQPLDLEPLPQTRLLCRILIVKVDGFRDKEILGDRYPDSILAELAPAAPGAPWVPVRLTVEAPASNFGTKAATLVSATWRDP